MPNRFEKKRGGFLDMAISVRKKAKTFLDDVDKFVDWEPVEKFLKKKLRRHKDAVGKPAYPPLAMFKVLLLQRWYDLSDQGMDDALADRISFAVLLDSLSTTTPPTPQLSAAFEITCWKGAWKSSYSTCSLSSLKITG